jgi:hypothetical protein
MKIILIFLISAIIKCKYCNETEISCFGVSNFYSNVCSGNGKCISKDVCSCFSGHGGLNCDIEAPLNCSWNVIPNNNTNPTIDTLIFKNNTLFFDIITPIFDCTLNSTVYVQNTNNFINCSFPVVNSIIDITYPCYNRFKMIVPWEKGKHCGWVVNNTDTFIVYSSNIHIATTVVSHFKPKPYSLCCGTVLNTNFSLIPISITFPTFVSVSSKLNITSPVNMIAAITKQTFTSGNPPTGSFLLLTSLQYPYLIDTNSTFSITTAPIGLTASIIEYSKVCIENHSCDQLFNIGIIFTEACTFTGIYIATFKLKCDPNFLSNCGINTNDTIKVQISANSEDFCTVANVDIKLTGILQTFQDEQYQNTSTSFRFGSTSYYQATIISSQAKLKSSTIMRVEISNINKTSVLIDNFVISQEGKMVNFTVGNFTLQNSMSTRVQFQFDINESVINISSKTDNFFVTAFINVVYESIGGISIGKTEKYQLKKIRNSLVVFGKNISSFNSGLNFYCIVFSLIFFL